MRSSRSDLRGSPNSKTQVSAYHLHILQIAHCGLVGSDAQATPTRSPPRSCAACECWHRCRSRRRPGASCCSTPPAGSIRVPRRCPNRRRQRSPPAGRAWTPALASVVSTALHLTARLSPALLRGAKPLLLRMHPAAEHHPAAMAPGHMRPVSPLQRVKLLAAPLWCCDVQPGLLMCPRSVKRWHRMVPPWDSRAMQSLL
jgi:hypothetical protein